MKERYIRTSLDKVCPSFGSIRNSENITEQWCKIKQDKVWCEGSVRNCTRKGIDRKEFFLKGERRELDKLSYIPYVYVVLGKTIEQVSSKVQETLKEERLSLLHYMSLSERAEVIQFGEWWHKQIKEGKCR